MPIVLQSLSPIATATMTEMAAQAGASRFEVLNAQCVRLHGMADLAAARAALEAPCLAQQIDLAVVPDGKRLSDYKLVAMDMDSTVITIECIDEMAAYCGKKAEVSAITEAAMRGEITDFNESLRRRLAVLKGLDASALEQVYEKRLQLSLGAERMLKHVQSLGMKTLLVSGGFTFFTERLKARLGLDFTRANQLEIIDGKLTGNVLGEIVNAEVKARVVQETCAQLGISSSDAIVMGDGSNDLKMMAIAGLSVAFRAKPVVRAQAHVALNFVGLDGVLNLFA